MQATILLPELGVATVILSVWYAEQGEFVHEGERVAEVLLGSATFDVSAPVSGWLSERRAQPNERLTTGDVLGILEVQDEPGEEQ
jgi:pyruvate/2-oxoglutarate dehydrogenase complex dihydrolipoamide acyltransferase (E2) component